MTFKDLKVGRQFYYEGFIYSLHLIKLPHLRNIDDFHIEEYNAVSTIGNLFWIEDHERVREIFT